jgi:RNA polymerase sigma-70 factor (ECF subfamily)
MAVRHEADLELKQALLNGDEKRFNAFFEDYFPRVFRFASARGESLDDDAIRDVVQSTMTNAVRSMHTYRGDASMFTWLCQICRNEIAGHYRRANRSVPEVAADDDAIRPILESLEDEVQLSPDMHYENVQTRRLIQEILDCLPGDYANALEWKYIQGLSVTEIAERLKLTELAAQSMLARARTAFRKAVMDISPQLAPARSSQ